MGAHTAGGKEMTECSRTRTSGTLVRVRLAPPWLVVSSD